MCLNFDTRRLFKIKVHKHLISLTRLFFGKKLIYKTRIIDTLVQKQHGFQQSNYCLNYVTCIVDRLNRYISFVKAVLN